MGRPALSIEVKQKDQNKLAELLSGGIQQVRVVLRALALLQLAQGLSAPRIATLVRLTAQAIRDLARRYQQGGLDAALYDKRRPGAAQILDDSQKQRVIAMVCASPPEGRARWTVRLVAQEAVKRGLIPRVGRETIRILLLDHDLKPCREKNVVRGQTRRRLHRQDGRRARDV
ncbi:MAG: helix-turn-helix domain-containing protein [Methylocella sp.]